MDNEKKFLEEMTEILDADEGITLDSDIEDIGEWDSIAHVAFFALARTNYNKKVDRTAVVYAKTIRDLYEMIK